MLTREQIHVLMTGMPVIDPRDLHALCLMALASLEAQPGEAWRTGEKGRLLDAAEHMLEVLEQMEEKVCVCDQGDPEVGLASIQCEYHTLRDEVSSLRACGNPNHAWLLRDGQECRYCAALKAQPVEDYAALHSRVKELEGALEQIDGIFMGDAQTEDFKVVQASGAHRMKEIAKAALGRK